MECLFLFLLEGNMINKELEDKINKQLVIPAELIAYEPNVTEEQLKRIMELLEAKKYRKFYQCGSWRKVRADILRLYNHECILCKLLQGKITTHDNRLKSGDYRGLQVHHMLEIEYKSNHDYCLTPVVNGKANLILTCQVHHNLLHNRGENIIKAKNKFINEERW